ncbi:MAG: helix-turn-helix transcriptional regulator [Acidimicrobiales bacterium]|nr:helix-turn-helix transcriptional regulator [Acidimicrobiales bacterium]
MPLPADHDPAGRPMGDDEAVRIAEVMAAFSTGSRIKILFGLFDDRRTVEELATSIDLSARLVSQQLRVLRLYRLVAGHREGRHVHYRLADDHVRELLVAIRAHGDHVLEGEPASAPSVG